MSFGAFNARSDLRNIIIGHVCVRPEVGKQMKVLETILTPADGENVNVSCTTRTSSTVVRVETMDGLYLLKVKTSSGRTYIVEVMGRS